MDLCTSKTPIRSLMLSLTKLVPAVRQHCLRNAHVTERGRVQRGVTRQQAGTGTARRMTRRGMK